MQFLFTNIYGLLRTLRPRQWIKNGFVFIALLFDQKLTDWPLLLRTIFAFILFCMISSTVYIINDLVDLEKDKQHPKKKRRALPSGQLQPWFAVLAAVGILAVCLPLSFWLDPYFWPDRPDLLSAEPGLFLCAQEYRHHRRDGRGRRALSCAWRQVWSWPRPSAFRRGSICAPSSWLSSWPSASGATSSPSWPMGRTATARSWTSTMLKLLDEMTHLVTTGAAHLLLALYLFGAEPAGQPRHDADHSLCHLFRVPLPVPDPRQRGGRRARDAALHRHAPACWT